MEANDDLSQGKNLVIESRGIMGCVVGRFLGLQLDNKEKDRHEIRVIDNLKIILNISYSDDLSSIPRTLLKVEGKN